MGVAYEGTVCIILEVELTQRFIIPEESDGDPKPGPNAVGVRIGNRKGVKTVEVGAINGVVIENVTIVVELTREGYANRLAVDLVTPLASVAGVSGCFAHLLLV
jgi:hypothetical protein